MDVGPLIVSGSNSGTVGGSNESRQLHSRDDVDFDRSSHHHTLGDGPMQAQPGSELTRYATINPLTITPGAGALGAGITSQLRWRDLKGTIIFHGEVVFGATGGGTAGGSVLTISGLPFVIPISCRFVGAGREVQSTGFMMSVQRMAASSIGLFYYNNTGPIANNNSLAFSGMFEKG